MAMPAYVGGRFDMAGMKWYGSNVENREVGLPRSILMMMLNDKKTGAPLAFMSANLLSAYRTAGIPGVGVKNLAVQNAKVLGIVGPGVINTITIETFAALRPTLDTLKIKGRGKASIDRCIEYVKEKMSAVQEYYCLRYAGRMRAGQRYSQLRHIDANGKRLICISVCQERVDKAGCTVLSAGRSKF